MSGGRLGVPEAPRGIARVCLRPPGLLGAVAFHRTPRGLLESPAVRARPRAACASAALARLVRGPRLSPQRPPPLREPVFSSGERACPSLVSFTGVCVTTPGSVSVLNSCRRRHRPFLWGGSSRV